MNWVLHNNGILTAFPPVNGEVSTEIPAGIWNLDQEALSGMFYLKKVGDSFEMPAKVYGVESDFIAKIDHVVRNMTRHIGMVFAGEPGSGKTITAKRISNNLILDQNIPTILVNRVFNGLAEFIAGLDQKVVFLFDEYEKVFNTEEQESKLLTVLDGVLTAGHKKIFIMTRNKPGMHYAMKDRPSRIRYYKEFGRLPESVVREILQDKLHNQSLLEEGLKYLKALKTLSMDMVNEVVYEINVTGEIPVDFNADERTYYGLFVKIENDWIEVDRQDRFLSWDINKKDELCSFGRSVYGFLKEIISYKEFLVEYPSLDKLREAKELSKKDADSEDADYYEEELHDLNSIKYLKGFTSLLNKLPSNPVCRREGVHRYMIGVCREGEFQNFERSDYFSGKPVDVDAW